MLDFLKSVFSGKSSFAKPKNIDDLVGHYFKYGDPETQRTTMEIWIQEAEDEEEGIYELISTEFGPWGSSDTSQLIDSTGMIRRCIHYKGRPTTHWLQHRLRKSGLTGKMGKIAHPVFVHSKFGFRGLTVWHVQYPEEDGQNAYIYFDVHTGIRVAQTGQGVLVETSFPMKLPK